jgi:RPA family protein
MREEIFSQLVEEMRTNFKLDLLKQVNERVKETQKSTERSLTELRELLTEKSQQIEEIYREQQAHHKESALRNEKLQKSIKDSQLSSEELVNNIGEILRGEID